MAVSQITSVLSEEPMSTSLRLIVVEGDLTISSGSGIKVFARGTYHIKPLLIIGPYQRCLSDDGGGGGAWHIHTFQLHTTQL